MLQYEINEVVERSIHFIAEKALNMRQNIESGIELSSKHLREASINMTFKASLIYL